MTSDPQTFVLELLFSDFCLLETFDPRRHMYPGHLFIRTFVPRTFVPRIFGPQGHLFLGTFVPWDICSLGHLSPRTFVPRDICSPGTFVPQGYLFPRDFFPREICSLVLFWAKLTKKFSQWSINVSVPQDICSQDFCSLDILSLEQRYREKAQQRSNNISCHCRSKASFQHREYKVASWSRNGDQNKLSRFIKKIHKHDILKLSQSCVLYPYS